VNDQVVYEETPLLVFISNDALFSAVDTVLSKAKNAIKSERDFYKNSVDPFSALFDAATAEITIDAWVKLEKGRQRQKTLQNAIGEFHEEILGSVANWERLPVGHLIDVISKGKKVISEVKNKHNTTKGSDKKEIYNNLKYALSTPEYKDFTAYYVEVIPKSAKTYNKPFTPSDNRTKTKMPENPNIRIIDGKSFYELVTGDKLALDKLYKVLPRVIADILSKPSITDYSGEELFHTLFTKAFYR